MGELHAPSNLEHPGDHTRSADAAEAAPGDPEPHPGAATDVLLLQRTAGNAAVTRFLSGAAPTSPGSSQVARKPLPGEVHTPREPPLRAPATVIRAKKLKVEVDQETEPLVASALQLSERATPVIERFAAVHEGSLDALRATLRPWLPESGIDWGTVLQFAIGLSLLPIPARGFYAVAKELIVETGQNIAGGAASEAQQAIEAARNGVIMAEWMQGTQLASETAVKARAIVRQNYDTAAKLQLAVLRPWNDLTRAEAAGDEARVLESAAAFVQVAPTFLREATRAAEASRSLVVSYLVAAPDNAPRSELRRKLAVVLPDVMKGLSDRKGVIGMQGADARAPFIAEVLGDFFPEVQPRSMARWSQSRHSIADIVREGASLFERGGTPARPGPRPTIEYEGTELGEYQGVPPLDRIHALAEAKMQVSLPPVEAAIQQNAPWVMDPSVIINHWAPRGAEEQNAIALGAAEEHAAHAREHWGRMAGVVP